MTVSRLFAILLIVGAVSAGWWVLGATVQVRTTDLDESLSTEMASLWGPKVLAQASPYCASSADAAAGLGAVVRPAASTITADIRHQHRYKGLLWYSTFDVDFTGRYTIPAEANRGYFVLPLPGGASTYHALSVSVDGNDAAIAPADISNGRIAVAISRDVEHVVTVHYATGGQDLWLYSPGEAPAMNECGQTASVPVAQQLHELRGFDLTVTTDFAEIDYPRGTLSPSTRAEPTGGGMRATWKYPRLITRQAIGIAMPKRPNAGPIVARMSYFAPVSLVFFFTVLFAVVVLKGIRLHPMHTLFIAAGFFAFHILMAYLADLINIHPAFWISASVSVLLVVTYMRLVAGVKFALLYTGLAQGVYLVGFSYAFFWVGRTGLTITVCAVVTLFVLMQATGRMDWHALFRHPERPRPIVIPPVVPADPQAPAET